VVRRGGVPGVDGEELALDVGREVLDEVGVADVGQRGAEGRALDGPLEEGLDGDVESRVGVLAGDDAVLAKVASAPGRVFSTSTRSRSVALIAFSQAITVSRARSAERCSIAFAMSGATKRSTLGPTAVVTMSAEAISAITSASWVALLSAR
jgi:hypothetical protein